MASEIRVTNIKANDGTASLTVANSTGAVTTTGNATVGGAINADTINEKTSANGVSIDGLKIKDYSLMYGSNIGLTINSSGYALTPKTVWFHAYNGATQNTSAAVTVVEFSSAQQDSSNSYSTSTDTFTAPVGGTYYFSYSFMNNAAEHCRHAFYVNGSNVNTRFTKDQIYVTSNNFWVGSLSNGDSVNVRIDVSANNEGHVHNDFRVFTGFLIG